MKRLTEYFVKRLFQWAALKLRLYGHDVRLCKDSRGNFTFQGEFKYVGSVEIAKRRSE